MQIKQYAFNNTFFPLFLMVVCPPVSLLFWYANVNLNGSLSALGVLMVEQGVFPAIWKICSPVLFGSFSAWVILSLFAVFQLLLMKGLPGKIFHGPPSPKGNIPVYKANGVLAYLVTLTLYLVGSFGLGLFPASILYDRLGELLGALNFFSLLFCFGLLLKGYFWPSSTDSDRSGNLIFDYYWGVELYPRILGWDVKMFTNCRFGLMMWALILISCAAKQRELYGLSDSMMIAVSLQLIYLMKFYVWETGYLGSLDIMHDRAGFYICWGCLVWVPAIYTASTVYLVGHPHHLGLFVSSSIFFFGLASIFINYQADRQRQLVRSANGACKIWGKEPVLIQTIYKTDSGKTKKGILLVSGWWGVSRHFHYIPEILAAFFWTIPALFHDLLPYFYLIFLTVLLIHRSFRDDKRCAKKYGIYWDAYKKMVPNNILPSLKPLLTKQNVQ